MKLRPCGDVLLVEPDYPEPEVVEFTLDDAEAREETVLKVAVQEFTDEMKRNVIPSRFPVHGAPTHADFGPRLKRSHGI